MQELENLVSYFSESLKFVFEMADIEIIKRINEIRLRRGGLVVVVIKNTSYFIDYNADLYDMPNDKCVRLGADELEEIFMAMCGYSLHSVMDSLMNGYITLPCGARVGVALSGVYEKGELISVKDVTSLNIRIPREVKDCSKPLLDFLYVNSFPSVIIAGEPNSGKTTLLRDIARNLSSGFNHHFRKIALIDERGELAGKEQQELSLDVGINTDVLTSFSKAKGIELATRTLSPEMIICDEIATEAEVNSILYAFSSGVRFALSVHLAGRGELYRKPIVKRLLATGEFSYIILLQGHKYKYDIIDASEVLYESNRLASSDAVGNNSRHPSVAGV